MKNTFATQSTNTSPEIIENVPFDELRIGQSAALTRTLALADVRAFAAVSGDVNPAHLDPVYAADTRFHGIVGHGMWSGALLSAVLGTELPGLGTIYLEQSLRFRRPVRLGDTLTARVTVRSKQEEKKRVEFDCAVSNQHGEAVVVGIAWVIAPTHKLRRPRIRLPAIELIDADETVPACGG
jgi:phosphate acetyltransferase